MKWLILSEDFEGIQPWLFYDRPIEGMPAVYHFFQYLGQSESISFHAIIVNKVIDRTISLPNGSTIRMIRLRANPHYLWKFLSFFYHLWIGTSYLRRHKVELVYGMGFYGLAANFLGKYFRKKTVNRKYGCLIWELLQEKRFFRIYTRHFFEVAAFKYAPDLTISTEAGMFTEEVATYFNPNIRIHSLYNGMDNKLKNCLLQLPLVENLPDMDQMLQLCYIARLGISKRQDLAIEVVEILVRQFGMKNIRLDLIGNGLHYDQLSKMIQEKGLDEWIRILPAFPQQALPEVLCQYHICMFCYDGGIMGNILWESMLSGRLIAIRKTGNHHLFNETNAILAEAGNDFTLEMAQAIFKKLGMPIGSLTYNSRKIADDLITSWEERFAKEMKFISILFPKPTSPR